MLAKKSLENLRTWIELDREACRRNYEIFRRLIGPRVHPHTKRGAGVRTNLRETPRSGVGVKLWAVVKSNAYGHGLFAFSKLVDSFGIDGFCVDSFIEGLKLRKSGIKKDVLVLGPTLPGRLPEAKGNKIAVTVSSLESLRALLRAQHPPQFHIKVDTGMHRQGFYVSELPGVMRMLAASKHGKFLSGIYTHFAAAKDRDHQAFTKKQLTLFKKAVALFEQAGWRNLVRHAAATGGVLLGPEYHLDAVRVGIGLYGLWPSEELERQLRRPSGSEPRPRESGLSRTIRLHPVLSWRAVVTEVKKLKAGDYVGYDCTERIRRPTTMAVLPVGYWHGFPRLLSRVGEVLIRGRRARVLGRVSMDLLTVDADRIPCKAGEIATLIGKDGSSEIRASDLAKKAGTSHYEIVTRLNPLMEKIVV